MSRRLLAVLAAALAVAGCSALGDRSVPRSDLENAVQKLMEEQSGQPVDSVSCDDDLAGEVNASVHCTATVAGEEVGLTVTTTDVDGNDVRYEVRNDTASPTPAPTEPTPSPTSG